MNDHETNDHEPDLADLPDLTGMTFHEIEAKYGEEVAINAGIAADPDTFELTPEWFKRARPAIEVMPELVERYRRYKREKEANMDGQDGQDGSQGSEL